MEGSVFRLFGVVVVAAVLIYIAAGYFLQGNDAAIKEIRNSLDYAEANEGKLHNIQAALKAGTGLSGKGFDTASRSVRFECSSSASCAGTSMKIGPRSVSVSADVLENIYSRCKKKGGISDCVLYFGEKPANLEIRAVSLPEKLSLKQAASLSAEIVNNGSLDAVDAGYAVKIYRKRSENNKETLLLAQDFSGKIGRLGPDVSMKISQQLSPDLSGKYLVKIIAEGEDSGIAFSEKEFEVSDAVAQSCSATQKGSTSLEGGKCRTQHLCSGCEFGFECSTRWQQKGLTSAQIKESSPGGVYTEKEPVNGECK